VATRRRVPISSSEVSQPTPAENRPSICPRSMGGIHSDAPTRAECPRAALRFTRQRSQSNSRPRRRSENNKTACPWGSLVPMIFGVGKSPSRTAIACFVGAAGERGKRPALGNQGHESMANRIVLRRTQWRVLASSVRRSRMVTGLDCAACREIRTGRCKPWADVFDCWCGRRNAYRRQRHPPIWWHHRRYFQMAQSPPPPPPSPTPTMTHLGYRLGSSARCVRETCPQRPAWLKSSDVNEMPNVTASAPSRALTMAWAAFSDRPPGSPPPGSRAALGPVER